MQTIKSFVFRSIGFACVIGMALAACASPGGGARPATNPKTGPSYPNANAATVSAKPGSRVLRTVAGGSRYENQVIGFALDFEPRWIVWGRVAEMRADFRDSIAVMEQNGQEVLLAAHMNNIVGCRITTENLNVPVADYATVIMDINKAEVDVVRQRPVSIAGRDMIEWEAKHPETGLVFIEYVLLESGFNLRMTFWTHPSLIDRYRPEFRKIVETMSTI